MSEKIRGALFAVLGDVSGLTFLDAYAGSGAIGIEAFSRGASYVLMIEKDKTALNTITKNIDDLNIDRKRVKLVSANSTSWSDNNYDSRFDIVILDPPYNHVQTEALDKLSNHAKKDGILVLSLPPGYNLEAGKQFNVIKTKDYGDSRLVFCRKIV